MPDYSRLPSDFFTIDPEKLDEQWFRFARDYYEHACLLADAREEYERMKSRREVIAAELDRDIRQQPDTYGVAKITEAVIEKTVLLQKRFRKADEDVIIAKHNVDIMQAAIEAMDGKKKGLENAVRLRLAAYSAEPRVDGDAGDKMRETELRDLRRMGQKRTM